MGEPTGLAPEQLRALDRLKIVPGFEQLYLAGGSAVAFHLEHRRSVDLDLFSLTADVDLERFRDRAAQLVPGLGVMAVTDVSARFEVDGVPVDIVRYPYAPIETPEPGPADVPVASLADLAAMKLAAIARRGIRRDFWDLYSIIDSGRPLTESMME